jgi:outer membrane protein assembly factor BamB
MRRGTCTGAGGDVVQATPAVQLGAYSNAAFTAAQPNRDLVYVLTYHGCGDTTGNQVIALDASNLAAAPVWTFNATGGTPMDYGSEGCSIDYDNNRLYCGTNQPSGGTQKTVWAIDTRDGTLVWSVNANAVHNRPQLLPGPKNHLFVADMNAHLFAFDAATGAQAWMLTLNSTPGAYVSNNLWGEFRAPFQDQVFVTDSAGFLYGVVDNGTSGSVRFTLFGGAAKAMSPVVVSPTPGKAFVGLSDGTVHQIDLASGTDDKNRIVASANAPTPGNPVVEPTLFLLGAATDINRMIVSSSGNFGTVARQIWVPF